MRSGRTWAKSLCSKHNPAAELVILVIVAQPDRSLRSSGVGGAATSASFAGSSTRLALLVSPVLRGQGVARGDGRPVLLLPGFLAGDYTLTSMALWLRRIGYRPGGGSARRERLVFRSQALRQVERRAESLAAEHGRRVGVIGHSRGVHLGKALASRRPELVSHLVGLGGGLSDPMAISTPTRGGRRTGPRLAPPPQPAGMPERLLPVSSRAPIGRRFRSRCGLRASIRRQTGRAVAILCRPLRRQRAGRRHARGLAFNAEAYRAIAAALAKPERQPA